MKNYFILKNEDGIIVEIYSRPQQGKDLELVDENNSELQEKFASENAEYERSMLIKARANEILTRQAESELVDEGVIERVISR